MKNTLGLLLLAFSFAPSAALAQGKVATAVRRVVSLPATCSVAQVVHLASDNTLYTCGPANTWSAGGVPGGGGANTALSNLASVAINTTLLPATDGSANLGSITKAFGAGTIGTGVNSLFTTYDYLTGQYVLGVSKSVTAPVDPDYYSYNVLSMIEADPSANFVNSAWSAGNFTANSKAANDKNFSSLNGLEAYSYHNGTGTLQAQYGTYTDVQLRGAATVGALYGMLTYSGLNNAGATVTDNYGMYAQAYNDAGTLTNNFGMFVDVARGTITNNYGLYIADQSAVGGTISRAMRIKGATAVSEFEGLLTALRTTSKVYTSGAVTSVSNTSAASCGSTAATIAGTDNNGIITVGATSGTSCTVTFGSAATTRRECTVTNETTANLVRSVYLTTTTSKFDGVFVAGDVLAYVCLAR